jgi:phosphoribosylglycinamide formyltransferase-1
MNVAVFASGGGSNFQALIDAREAGRLHASLSLCVVNNSTARAAERAKLHGIPLRHIAPSHFASEKEYAGALLGLLSEHSIECVALAGYMKKIPSTVVAAFPHHIVNIHPGLLPAFGGAGLYGERVHQAVLDYGAKVSGVTIHFVDEEYDHGPIIFQATAPVLDTDDAHALAERVLALEHDSYWRVLEALCQGRITVRGRRVYGTV